MCIYLFDFIYINFFFLMSLYSICDVNFQINNISRFLVCNYFVLFNILCLCIFCFLILLIILKTIIYILLVKNKFSFALLLRLHQTLSILTKFIFIAVSIILFPMLWFWSLSYPWFLEWFLWICDFHYSLLIISIDT